jgi:hypothetical protein
VFEIRENPWPAYAFSYGAAGFVSVKSVAVSVTRPWNRCLRQNLPVARMRTNRRVRGRDTWAALKVTLAVAAICVVGLVGRRFYRAYLPSGIDETGIVTVTSVIGGHAGKYNRWAEHRVRLESGSDATMTFREIFPPGTRVWVSYRRYPQDDRFHVRLYVRQRNP